MRGRLGGLVRENYIYLVVLALLLLLAWVIYIFQSGVVDVEAAKVYLQALTAIATLALLYYTYYNVASKREEDIARLELAVRPVLVWELGSTDGGAQLFYKTMHHPIYDFCAVLSLGGKQMRIDERHLDVSEVHPGAERKLDVSKFISPGLGREKMRLLSLDIRYHSEVGGKYEFSFSKEVVKKPHGFLFQHRKIISAKYPWRKEPVRFED